MPGARLMTDAELEALLADLESDRVERTSGERDRDKIREAICAFSNDLPDHRLPGIFFIWQRTEIPRLLFRLRATRCS